MHIMRMSHYSRLIALEYGFSEAGAENLFNAAPMHDIGKIGIHFDPALIEAMHRCLDKILIVKQTYIDE